MTNQQNKLLEIAFKFHSICEENGLRYYLIAHQLSHAAKDGVIRGYELDIAMYIEDWKKMMEISEDLEEIEIESIEDTGHLLGCYYRWVDKGTLMLHLDRFNVFAKPGIGLNVHIIRRTTYRSKFFILIERFMKNSFREKPKVLRVFRPLFEKRIIRKMIHKGMLLNTARRGAKSVIIKDCFGQCIIPKNKIGVGKNVRLGGTAISTIKDYNYYLTNRYGKRWKSKNPFHYKETYRCIFSTEIPYSEYMSRANNDALITQEFINAVRRFGPKYNKYKKMVTREQDGWDRTMFLAGERFRLWKKYEPQKEYLKQLMNEFRYDEAELILKDYMRVLDKYLKKKIVVCFDEEILEMVKAIYEANGHMKTLRAIDQYILEEDKEEIKLG